MDERDVTYIATANGWDLPYGWKVVNEVLRTSDEGDVYEPVAEFAHWWMALFLRSLTLSVWVADELGYEVANIDLDYDSETDPFADPGFLEAMVNEVLYEAQECAPYAMIRREVRP